MKLARFVLKIVAACLTVAAVACCIIAYWDKITEFVHTVGKKLGLPCCQYASEYDDYADWDD